MRGMPTVDESKPIWQTMGVFLIPLVLSSILQSAGATLNSIFLGRMIGVGALAVVSSVFPIVFFLISFLIGIGSGSSVLIGQAKGAGDLARMKAIAGTTLALSLALGIVVAIVGSLATESILTALGTPHDILAAATSYARILFIMFPILFVYLSYTTFIRGTGDSATPFYFLVVSTVISFIVTPALIQGWLGLPRLGINSAAYAGIVAYVVALAALVVYLRLRRHPLAFDREVAVHFTFNWPILKAVVRIGLPTGLQLVLVSLSEIAVIAFVNQFGSRATAAYGAVNQVVSYVQFPAISVGIAASIFGAQAIGAKRLDRLRGIVRSAIALNYITMVVLIAIVYAFSWVVLGLFITDASTLDIAHSLLMITLWSYAIFGNSAVISGIMRSSGTVLWPTLISLVAIWGVEVPVAYLLSRGPLGLNGIWYAYPIAFLCSLTGNFIYYHYFWLREKISALLPSS